MFDIEKFIAEKDSMTMAEAIEESIKLWTFLSEDGRRQKHNYFGIRHYPDIVASGCFLCEYIFNIKSDSLMTNSIRETCILGRCPLSSRELCLNAHPESAFYMWLNSTDPDIKKMYAREILEALLFAREDANNGI